MTDPLTKGLTATALTGTGGTVSATRSDALGAGGSYPNLTLTVSVSATAPLSVTNTASVSGGGEVNTSNDTSSDTTTISPVADLTISNAHNGLFHQGDTTGDIYIISVSNEGAGVTSGSVTVTDTLPVGLTPTAADTGTIKGWKVSFVGQTITATRSDVLPAGFSYLNLTLAVRVSATAPSSVTNTASVSGGGEVVTTNDTANDVSYVAQGMIFSTPTLAPARIGFAFRQAITVIGGAAPIHFLVTTCQQRFESGTKERSGPGHCVIPGSRDWLIL